MPNIGLERHTVGLICGFCLRCRKSPSDEKRINIFADRALNISLNTVFDRQYPVFSNIGV